MQLNRRKIPEFELGETADKGLELIRASSRERSSSSCVVELRIDKRGQEADEEIEEVDAEGVGDDVETVDGDRESEI